MNGTGIFAVLKEAGMFAEHGGAAYQICKAEILATDHSVSLPRVQV